MLTVERNEQIPTNIPHIFDNVDELTRRVPIYTGSKEEFLLSKPVVTKY